MRKAKRIVIWLLGGVVLTFLAAVGAWLYATSNVAVPDYEVVEADGDIELRAYPDLVVAEVTTSGPRDQGVRAGFGPLAGYIFAKERAGDKIAMTAPVTQQAGAAGDWTVQFIMPAEYQLADLPKPAGAAVKLAEEPAMRRVAIRFSGRWKDETFAEKEAVLRAWLETRDLTPVGAPIYAYYNDPFTPGFLRRNEVIFNLGPADQTE